ncbi:MAG: DUF3791 domain-containing protein [Victivallales bacterium]|nr:DUF3791 domain-containing protein [Victivallales bacterium]
MPAKARNTPIKMTEAIKVTEFVVFCIEMYAQAHQLSGVKVAVVFENAGLLHYLSSCYQELHANGKEWLLNTIDEFLKNRGVTIE